MGWVIYLLLVITIYLLFGHAVAMTFFVVTGTLWLIALVVALIKWMIDEGKTPAWLGTFAGLNGVSRADRGVAWGVV
jgi:hypothetical protein